MKNKKSIYLITAISLFIGLLHFLIGPNYQGIFKTFISGYLLDGLVPMNLYLLLQISLRERISVNSSRITAALFTGVFGILVEVLQFYHIKFLGSTYDPLDLLMYAFGIGAGILIDLTVIENLEGQKRKNE